MPDAPPPQRSPRLGVWDGIAITCGVLALLGLLGLAVATPHFEDMYKEMGNAPLPRMTIRLLRGGNALRIGVPFALLIAFVLTFVRRVPAAVRFGLALLMVLVAVIWLWALYEPIFVLAGNIQ